MALQRRDKNGHIAMCDGKAPLTWAVAKSIMNRNPHKRWSPYHCPFCRAWHLGSNMGKFGRRQ